VANFGQTFDKKSYSKLKKKNVYYTSCDDFVSSEMCILCIFTMSSIALLYDCRLRMMERVEKHS